MPTTSYRRRLAAALTAVALGTAGAIGVATPAFAVDYTVTDLTELQNALVAANLSVGVPDVIEFDVPVFTSFDYPDSLQIDDDLTMRLAAGSAGVRLHSTNNDAVDVNGVSFTATGDISFDGDLGAGILADAADLTLTGVTLSTNSGSGLFQLNGGSLVATDIDASNNGGTGIGSSGAITTFQITEASINNNLGTGVFLDTNVLVTASLEDVVANDNNPIGINLSIDNGTISVTDSTATNNFNSGLFLFVDGGVGTVTSVDTTLNETGMNLWVDGGGVITASGLTADSNDTGLDLRAFLGAISVSSSTARFNGAGSPALLGGGVAIEATDGSVTLDGVDASSNQAVEGAGIGISEISGGSSVTIRNSTISENIGDTATGISLQQIIDTGSTFDLIDSTVSGNNSVGLGAGLAIFTAGSATEAVDIDITRSTIAGNNAASGSGIMALALFGAGAGTPVLTIDSSTISGNDGTTPGVVLQSEGTTAVEASIVNSTISGNLDTHGGVYADLSGDGPFVVDIAHSTITDNVAGGGSGGVSVIDGAHAIIQHSIVGGNDGTDFFSDPASSYDIDWSIVSDTSGSAAAAAAVAGGTGNIVGDPQLGTLALNGGPTRTHLPLAGSPAVNAGNPAIVGAPALEQRGLARILDGRIDIGATEVPLLIADTGGTITWPLLPVGAALLLVGAAMLLLPSWRKVARVA
jgi:hypothetical protein